MSLGGLTQACASTACLSVCLWVSALPCPVSLYVGSYYTRSSVSFWHVLILSLPPPSSSRWHLSYDGLSGGEREDYQNCSVLYRVLKLCTVISSLRWAVHTVLWIGFCHTGLISLCVDSLCLCLRILCSFSYCICVVLL